jgi:hypothetical protein
MHINTCISHMYIQVIKLWCSFQALLQIKTETVKIEVQWESYCSEHSHCSNPCRT